MIDVLHPGILSSIQDLGRYGYRHLGVPLSGVMDSYSATFANLLLQNNHNAAVIEATMTGPKLQFKTPTVISISGADMQPKCNGNSIPMHQPIIIKANDILSFGKLTAGLRTYIAVKDGFQSESVLNSCSMYQGITPKQRLKVGDTIAYKPYENNQTIKTANVKYKDNSITERTLEAYLAPEFSSLSDKQKALLLNSEFKVSKYNNRMAYRLHGFSDNVISPILTSAVLPGTVQLTPSGELIVLMRDAQTTGGYPRVLQLTEQAINCLSQKMINTEVNFKLKPNLS